MFFVQLIVTLFMIFVTSIGSSVILVLIIGKIDDKIELSKTKINEDSLFWYTWFIVTIIVVIITIIMVNGWFH